ncbi:MSHA biogenesis protein MshJ [Marinobacter lutaoensis]|uniref:MSHA biogenesis protein MshJ n=1 Tax=Marinobacter lutaoensis TaxID=135739 RepID=UPI001593A407|nr:MSHA biogenesis protein MshJ [Marinobacter lutaoensis]NVD36783.1 MSHA biogenesis protein MshJ [Marinobacter lutaoensis]
MTSPVVNAWKRGLVWFDERPLRERALLLATVLLVILFLGWHWGLAPMWQANNNLEFAIQSAEGRRDELRGEQRRLERLLSEDPSRELQAQLASRQRQLDRLERDIAATTGQLIAPRAMVALLKDILATQPGLTLQSMALKTPTPIYGDPSGEGTGDSAPSPLLYAHQVELRIQGAYLDVLSYLERLEAVDERLGWVSVSYQAGEWPQGEAVIEVRTLSLEKTWLGV